jgi:hypothetical protein
VGVSQSEWGNPQNWTGPRWLSVYFSKADTRTWIPKQIPTMGMTLNLGKRRAYVVYASDAIMNRFGAGKPDPAFKEEPWLLW